MPFPSLTATSSLIEVSINVDGKPLPIYTHNGALWIAGEPGKPYSIVVRNRTSRRIEVLESVDGRNVLKDEAATFYNSGMVISDLWDNHGWRLNDSETRDFVFSDPATSIAVQATGSTQNVGVIGAAAFAEKVEFPRPGFYGTTDYFGSPSTWTMDDGSTLRNTGARVKSSGASWTNNVQSRAGGQSLSAPADLGTGMGDLRNDAVGHTTFVRATGHPASIIEIQYRTHDWLVSQGIVKPTLPSAWPGVGTGYENYVK